MVDLFLNTPLFSKNINNYFHQIYLSDKSDNRIRLIRCNSGFTISCIEIDDQILPAEWRVKTI